MTEKYYNLYQVKLNKGLRYNFGIDESVLLNVYDSDKIKHLVISEKEYPIGKIRQFYYKTPKIRRPELATSEIIIRYPKIKVIYDKTLPNALIPSDPFRVSTHFSWDNPGDKFIHRVEGGNLGRKTMIFCIEYAVWHYVKDHLLWK